MCTIWFSIAAEEKSIRMHIREQIFSRGKRQSNSVNMFLDHGTGRVGEAARKKK